MYFLLRFVLSRFMARKWAALIAGGLTLAGASTAGDGGIFVAATGIALLLLDMRREPPKEPTPGKETPS